MCWLHYLLRSEVHIILERGHLIWISPCPTRRNPADRCVPSGVLRSRMRTWSLLREMLLSCHMLWNESACCCFYCFLQRSCKQIFFIINLTMKMAGYIDKIYIFGNPNTSPTSWWNFFSVSDQINDPIHK